MGFSDRLKDIRSKAEQAVVEHKDQIQDTVQKVGQVADQRTKGKYSDRIQKLGDKASSAVESFDPGSSEPAPAAETVTDTPPEQPAEPA